MMIGRSSPLSAVCNLSDIQVFSMHTLLTLHGTDMATQIEEGAATAIQVISFVPRLMLAMLLTSHASESHHVLVCRRPWLWQISSSVWGRSIREITSTIRTVLSSSPKVL
jgi:hypothetical protein